VFIAGNEGLASVVQAGPSDKHIGLHKFREGDWVVMRKPQSGTWANWKVADAVDLMPIPKRHAGSKVTEVFGATMMVNFSAQLLW
jgi:NADPH:quinone reductase-like Zn-dependent oxidoreductase